jgi:hypothetical protein
MDAEYWCCCRKYCHGQWKCLKSLRTWQRHLQEADEDEKPRVRAARLSRSFQDFVATMNDTPTAGPSLDQPSVASGSGRTLSKSPVPSSDDDGPSRKRRCGSGDPIFDVRQMYNLAYLPNAMVM